VEDVFTPLSILDQALGARPGSTSSSQRRGGREDGSLEDGLEVVYGGRTSVGSGDGPLLQTVKLEISLTEGLGDLELEGLGDLSL
jgi:hypothetical protein